MNADNACASPAAVAHWGPIDWGMVRKAGSSAAGAFVKASRERRWGKVEALQRLLTCSFSGKALAVKRVTENKGK